VEALLAVAAHPDDEMAAMSYIFWHRLSRHLTSSFGSGPGADAKVLCSTSEPAKISTCHQWSPVR
jgi:hypothetical protein